MQRATVSNVAAHACIVCDSEAIRLFLDLGETALANNFLTAEQLAAAEPRYPLRVGFCHACGHVQLMEFAPPPAMFEDYLYISSASDTLRDHLHELSDIVIGRYPSAADDLVVDIGCNDGTLMQGFRRHGVRTLGVDPAKNLADLTRDSGVERFVGFFNLETARRIVAEWGPCRIITATNTFPHIPDLHDFVAGIHHALAPGGVFVIEAHYLADILASLAFDTIYHEHVSYWALGPMTRLFAEHGLEVVDVERVPIHHGQLRVFVQRRGEGTVSPNVERLLEMERAEGLDRFDTFQHFAARTERLKHDLHARLIDLRAQGKQVVGYGAPAKGNTLLEYLELGPEVVEYIADRSPLKQGRYTPGTHIPVVSPERLLADQPDVVVLLAWNFAEEILGQLAAYRERGGRFIIPVPEVREL